MTSVRTTVRGTVPSIPFDTIARSILGTRYELSLVICGDTLATSMNKRYRNKHYRPNVLSFPLDKNEGEIFLNIRATQREAKRWNIRMRDRLAHLFVHGCYHLAGLDHGEKMERAEARTLARFGFAKPL